MNYYNEWDKKTAAWLQELINEGLIPDGHIDTRSICDVQPGDLDGYTQCHFFAGIGGWPLALQLAGWGERSVWTGSCPCQPFSAAGKRKGTADERHLWPELKRLIKACNPETIFGEQVAPPEVVGTQLEASFVIAVQSGDYARANKLAKQLVRASGFHYFKRWIDGIQADLGAEGYTVWPSVLGAHSAGAPHIRQRLYWVADARHKHGWGWPESEKSERGETSICCGLGDADFQGPQGRPALRKRGDQRTTWASGVAIPCADGKSRRVPKPQSNVLLMADGLWYNMVDVRAEFVTQAIMEVQTYATQTRTSAEEMLSLVQSAVGAQAFWKSFRGSGGIFEPEILLDFLRDISSTLDRTANSGSGAQARPQNEIRMLRDLRDIVATECSSLRQQSFEQHKGQSSNPVLVLSQFLACCCEACWYYESGSYAAAFPLTGKVKGRVMLLKGLGNAIVPACAQAFIEAYMETAK